MSHQPIHHSPFTIHPAKPWYREPWPWILMAGPAAVIVAGAFTIWLAVASADGLVAEDYYRRGLEINRELKREPQARKPGHAPEASARPPAEAEERP